ncbi:MAG: response regulator [Chloroflexota bacterium]
MSKHFLVVEDETITAKDIERMLKRMGDFSVATALSGEEALHQIELRKPDLVLMDIKLRGQADGIEAAQSIYERWNLPVVYVTAHSDNETFLRAKNVHPYGYLVKPVSYNDLYITIGMALSQHETEQRLRESEQHVNRLYLAERQQRELAETLVETSQALADTLDVNTVLDRILELVSRVVENDVCNIVLLEEGGAQVARSRGYEAFDAGSFVETFVFPLSGLSIRQHIIDSGEPVVVSDVRSDPDWELPADSAWLRSYVAAPIRLQTEVIGFINVGSSRPGFYHEAHAQRLLAFGHQAALAFQKARLFDETRATTGHLQVLSRRLLEVQETERRYIARELHDEIGQELTAAKLSLQAIRNLPAAAALSERLQECDQIIQLALKRVRDISLDLHPAVLDDLGLLPALRWFVDRESQWNEFNAQIVADNLPERLPAQIELVCFRVVQEALTNVSRHARARDVKVELWQRGKELHLIVRDNGIGFYPAEVLAKSMKTDSLGLLGMQERIMLAGGTIEIDSAPGRGCEIHARLPLA